MVYTFLKFQNSTNNSQNVTATPRNSRKIGPSAQKADFDVMIEIKLSY